MNQVTATAVRKAARKLGPNHPAVKAWRNAARRRIFAQCNADAKPNRVGAVPYTTPDFEALKIAVIEAANLENE